MADIARADNQNEAVDGETTITAEAALKTFVDSYTEASAQAELTAAETAVGNAEVTLLNAQSALANARNDIGVAGTVTTGDYLEGDRLTDANLAAALNEVKADIAATAGKTPDVSALLNARTQAEANLDTDIGKDGTNTETLVDLRSAIVAYAQAGGALTASVAAGATSATTVSDLLTSINVALDTDETNENTAAADALVADFYNETNTDTAEYAFTSANAEEKAIADAITVVTERDALVEAVTAAEGTLTAQPIGADLVQIEGLIDTREGLIQNVTEAEEGVAEAEQYFSELSALVEAYETAGDDVTDAQDALEELGVENLVELGATSTAGTAGEADLYLFSAENTENLSLLNFESNDQLFFGEGFARVDLATDADLSTERLGDSSALEVFFQQDGTNAIVTVETEAFGGNAQNLDDATQITLTGVNIDDLQFENGYVTVVEAA